MADYLSILDQLPDAGQATVQEPVQETDQVQSVAPTSDFESILNSLPDIAEPTQQRPSLTPNTDAAGSSETLRILTAPTVAGPGLGGFPSTREAVKFDEPLLDRNVWRKDKFGELIPIAPTEPGRDPLFYYATQLFGKNEKAVEWINSFSPVLEPRVVPETGDLVITLPATQNKPKREVPLNPRGMDWYDVMDVLTVVPQVGAAMAAALALHPAGAGVAGSATLGLRVMQMAGAALAGQYQGAHQDTMARVLGTLGTMDPEEAEIAKRRGAMAIVDFLFDAGLGAAAKSVGIFSAFSRSPTPMVVNQKKAEDLFRSTIGVNAIQTPSQKTGSGILATIESVNLGMFPQGQIAKIFEVQAEAIGRIKNFVAGMPEGGVPPSGEEVGQGVIEAVKKTIVGPAESALKAARSQAQATGNIEAVQVMDDLIGIKPMGEKGAIEAGKSIRARRQELFKIDKKHVDDLYDKAKKLPGGQGSIFRGDFVAKEARKIRSELPKSVEPESAGGEIVEKVIESGVPEGLSKFLNDLEALEGKMVSYDTLKGLRDQARNKMAETQAIPDVVDRNWNKVISGLTAAMVDATEQIPDGALKAAYKVANAQYIERIVPWDRKAFSNITRQETEGGFIPDESLVARLVGGAEAQYNWRTLRDALGPDSKAIKQVKRVVIDDLFQKGTDPTRKRLDPVKLEGLMKSFVDQNKVMAQDIFQGNEGKLFKILRSMKWADDNTLLDAEEVSFLISSGNLTARALEKVRDAAISRAKRYSNRLVGDVAQGFPIATKISPVEAVSELKNLNVPAEDVKTILDSIARDNPRLRDQVATIAMHDLFEKADYVVQGTKRTSASEIMDLVGGPNSDKRNRLELLAGPREIAKGVTRMNAVDALVDYLAPHEQHFEKLFKSGGSLARQNIASQVMVEPLKGAKGFAYRMASAYVYTRPYAMKFLGNEFASPERTAGLATALIGSEPFINEMVSILGTDGAMAVVKDLRDSIQNYVMDKFGQDQRPTAQPKPTP